MNQSSLRLAASALLLAIAGPVSAASAQVLGQDDELALLVGAWLGDDFIERRWVTTDVFGPVEFGSSLSQGSSVLVGLQYTAYLTNWVAAEVVGAYASTEWTTVSGRVTDGTLSGTTDRFTGVSTVPVSVNLTARMPLSGPGPTPFVSLGAGAVLYEFKQSNAPLVVTPAAGAPIDTLLFDLDLGFVMAPNAAAGVSYRLASKVALKLEARLWLTLVRERLLDETIAQKNAWIALSTAFVF